MEEYRSLIMELLYKVRNEAVLKRVYKLLEYLYIKEEAGI